jgi:hypothetical protein
VTVSEDRFNHAAHQETFPRCLTCHEGIVTASAPVFPQPTQCAACHDGTVEQRITWTPRTAPPRTNFRFEHRRHAEVVTSQGREPPACIDCHANRGAPWMSVRLTAIAQCLDCHNVTADHLAAPDSACATCHLPLARATRLTRDDIAAFEAPPSHSVEGFGTTDAHGRAARDSAGGVGVGVGVAASCATCHARDFCLTCHVDAPEQRPIAALALDPRSLAIPASLTAPVSHQSAEFLNEHGAEASGTASACGTCHTQESCVTCHVATRQVAAALHPIAPDRSRGAVVERARPASHVEWYRNVHGDEAAAAPATCAGCHGRQDCLECHRPDPASAPPGYHPEGFLTRHPAAAYDRVTSCNDCHNPGAFCATCHQASGLTTTAGELGAGYHDAKQGFIVGHGAAARQNLETCVSCHTEQDCLLCHSATGGRRVNPHGPGFDAERLARRASQMCTVCHLVIPN